MRIEFEIPTKTERVNPRIQILIDSVQPICVQYGGSGKYFDSLAGAKEYILSRWGCTMAPADRDIISDLA